RSAAGLTLASSLLLFSGFLWPVSSILVLIWIATNGKRRLPRFQCANLRLAPGWPASPVRSPPRDSLRTGREGSRGEQGKEAASRRHPVGLRETLSALLALGLVGLCLCAGAEDATTPSAEKSDPEVKQVQDTQVELPPVPPPTPQAPAATMP